MQMLSPDDSPPALPCWINGRAFLSMTEGFFVVIDRLTGKPWRRIPLCDEAEAEAAFASARAACLAWRATAATGRLALLGAWSDALAAYASHFALLLRQETGIAEPEAEAEVANAIALLHGEAEKAMERTGSIRVIHVPAAGSFAACARELAVALAAGACVVLHPGTRLAATLYALVELSARVGFAAGVINLVQGDKAMATTLSRLSAQERMP